MSLKTIHVMFVLIVMLAADLFGVWAIWNYRLTPDTTMLVSGILSFAAGIALIIYAIWFVRKSDRAHIE